MLKGILITLLAIMIVLTFLFGLGIIAMQINEEKNVIKLAPKGGIALVGVSISGLLGLIYMLGFV